MASRVTTQRDPVSSFRPKKYFIRPDSAPAAANYQLTAISIHVENEAQMTSKVPFFPAPLDSAKVQFLGVGVKCSPAECISENRKIFPNDSIVVFR